jgi:phage N-6-adenine-methyltransferase
MGVNAGMLSSASEEWATPPVLFERWHERYNFTIDVCATPQNAKCSRYWTKEDNALSQDWAGERCWMNPPYGRTISHWIRKAVDSAIAEALVVALIPARTDTRWFHRYIWNREGCKPKPGRLVDFMPGRRAFVKPGRRPGTNTAPFPSMVVVFNPRLED